LATALLEEAPAALIPDLDSLNASAQQLLTLVNDIVSLAQQQLQILSTQQAPPLLFESAAAAFLQSATPDPSQESPEKQGQSGMILAIDDSNLIYWLDNSNGMAKTTATSTQQAPAAESDAL